MSTVPGEAFWEAQMNVVNSSLIIALFVMLFITTTNAQETTSESDLHAVVSDLIRGQPDYDDMDAALRIAVREQMPQVEAGLRRLGAVVSVEFETTERGVDVYLVQHEQGRTVWQFARSPSGRIGVLYFSAF